MRKKLMKRYQSNEPTLPYNVSHPEEAANIIKSLCAAPRRGKMATLTGFETVEPRSLHNGRATYTDPTKIYVAPHGYLYMSRDLWAQIGEPSWTQIKKNEDFFALFPSSTPEHSFKIHSSSKEGHAVRIACSAFLKAEKLIVADYIVSYSCVIETFASDHKIIAWNRKQAPQVVRKAWGKTAEYKPA